MRNFIRFLRVSTKFVCLFHSSWDMEYSKDELQPYSIILYKLSCKLIEIQMISNKMSCDDYFRIDFRMAPFFVLLEVLFHFGYRPDFQKKIWKLVDKEIAKFKTQANKSKSGVKSNKKK